MEPPAHGGRAVRPVGGAWYRRGVRWLGCVLVLIGCGEARPAARPAGRFAGVDAAIARGEAPETTSVLVMRRGAVEHEAYFGGADAATLHDTRSVGKSITALAVGIAIDRGALPGVDARVAPYLEHLRPFARGGALKEAITVEDFLMMSSALDCDDFDPDSPGNEEGMYPERSWARWAIDLPLRADGDGWRYCTAGTFLLGQVIERAAGRPVDGFIAEHLFTPLGIRRWDFTRSPAGEVMTGGMLRLTTRDLAAIGELVRSRGAAGGAQLVSRGFVEAALTVRHVASAERGEEYGYLFWRRTHRTRCGDVAAWYMSGNGGNVVAIVDALEAVVVVTRTHYNRGAAMHAQTRRLLDEHVLPALACVTPSRT